MPFLLTSKNVKWKLKKRIRRCPWCATVLGCEHSFPCATLSQDDLRLSVVLMCDLIGAWHLTGSTHFQAWTVKNKTKNNQNCFIFEQIYCVHSCGISEEQTDGERNIFKTFKGRPSHLCLSVWIQTVSVNKLWMHEARRRCAPLCNVLCKTVLRSLWEKLAQ